VSETPKFHPHRGPIPRVLALVLAGGEGRRLWPLTADRAKPSVPMGGRYRLIDFVLSNLVNSGFNKIKVLTQYMSDSLNNHLSRGWRLPAMLDQYVEAVPAQQRRGREWFKGSADAIYQSLNVITDEDPDLVLIFGGDHVYKMDVRQMLDFHLETGAECTVAAIPVPVAEARAFGVIQVDSSWRILSFSEKPEVPAEIPGRPGWALASMGNYIFDKSTLVAELLADAEGKLGTQHDFGRNILPDMVGQRALYAYDFMRNEIPGMDERERGYWRDVGTISQYYLANMDLVQVVPVFSLYNPRWPVHTWMRSLPPAKFVFNEEGTSANRRIGFATDSLISEGCIISGGHVDRSVLGPRVRVNSYAQVEASILHEGVDIGRHCNIRRAIIDKHVRVPAGTQVGFDLEADRRRFQVSDGIVVIPKNHDFG
jgi:glucose-1-phosphate adenylyltransferase